MKKVWLFFVIFVTAGLLLWVIPFLSVAISAPAQDADLVLVKSDFPDPVAARKVLTYTLLVTNNGDQPATGVVLTDTLPTDTLPGEVMFYDASSGCNHDAGAGEVQCNLGNLAIGGSTMVTITVAVSSSTSVTITNQADVSSARLDPNMENNHAETLTIVDAEIPEVTWTKPVSNTEIFDIGCQTVLLKVTARDDISVDEVHFYRWDPVQGIYVNIGDDYTPPYQWDFNACVLRRGFNHIYVEAFDDAGNVSPWKDHYILLYSVEKVYLPVMKK